jgi:uncharacterized protein (TIGR02266 family)
VDFIGSGRVNHTPSRKVNAPNVDRLGDAVLASHAKVPDMHEAAFPRAPEGATAESVVDRVRIPFIQRASLACGDRVVDVFLVDLGLAGVFVELSDPPPTGERVSVRFRLPGNEIPIGAACEVAWRHEAGTPPMSLPPGAGLRFLELDPADRERVREHLAEYCRRATRGRGFARPWPVSGGEGGDP